MGDAKCFVFDLGELVFDAGVGDETTGVGDTAGGDISKNFGTLKRSQEFSWLDVFVDEDIVLADISEFLSLEFEIMLDVKLDVQSNGFFAPAVWR